MANCKKNYSTQRQGCQNEYKGQSIQSCNSGVPFIPLKDPSCEQCICGLIRVFNAINQAVRSVTTIGFGVTVVITTKTGFTYDLFIGNSVATQLYVCKKTISYGNTVISLDSICKIEILSSTVTDPLFLSNLINLLTSITRCNQCSCQCNSKCPIAVTIDEDDDEESPLNRGYKRPRKGNDDSDCGCGSNTYKPPYPPPIYPITQPYTIPSMACPMGIQDIINRNPNSISTINYCGAFNELQEITTVVTISSAPALTSVSLINEPISVLTGIVTTPGGGTQVVNSISATSIGIANNLDVTTIDLSTALITETIPVVTDLGDPTTVAAIVDLGDPTTVAALIDLGDPTTVAALVDLGDPTTVAALVDLGDPTTVAALVDLGDPTTVAALIDLGDPTTVAALTGITSIAVLPATLTAALGFTLPADIAVGSPITLVDSTGAAISIVYTETGGTTTSAAAVFSVITIPVIDGTIGETVAIFDIEGTPAITDVVTAFDATSTADVVTGFPDVVTSVAVNSVSFDDTLPAVATGVTFDLVTVSAITSISTVTIAGDSVIGVTSATISNPIGLNTTTLSFVTALDSQQVTVISPAPDTITGNVIGVGCGLVIVQELNNNITIYPSCKITAVETD